MLAAEPPPAELPRFEQASLPRSEAIFENGFRLAVADSGEDVVTVATWVSGGVPRASTAAAQLWFMRDLGMGWTVRDAYSRVGAGSEAVITPDGTLFIAVGPSSSLDVLLTLEQARWTTSESEVSDAMWSLLQQYRVPWIRVDGEVNRWTYPLLAVLHPESSARYRDEGRALEAREARAVARELYRPGNAATLVLGDFDTEGREAVLEAFGLPVSDASPMVAPPRSAWAVPTAPASSWADAGAGMPVAAAVGWALPGTRFATTAELEAVRQVAVGEASRRREEAACELHPRVERSTLVCSLPAASERQAMRRVRFLRRAVRPSRVADYVAEIHASWAREQVEMLGSASWQGNGRARTEGLAFGQTGSFSVLEAANAEAVARVVGVFLDPALSVGLVVNQPASEGRVNTPP